MNQGDPGMGMMPPQPFQPGGFAGAPGAPFLPPQPFPAQQQPLPPYISGPAQQPGPSPFANGGGGPGLFDGWGSGQQNQGGNPSGSQWGGAGGNSFNLSPPYAGTPFLTPQAPPPPQGAFPSYQPSLASQQPPNSPFANSQGIPSIGGLFSSNSGSNSAPGGSVDSGSPGAVFNSGSWDANAPPYTPSFVLPEMPPFNSPSASAPGYQPGPPRTAAQFTPTNNTGPSLWQSLFGHKDSDDPTKTPPVDANGDAIPNAVGTDAQGQPIDAQGNVLSADGTVQSRPADGSIAGPSNHSFSSALGRGLGRVIGAPFAWLKKGFGALQSGAGSAANAIQRPDGDGEIQGSDSSPDAHVQAGVDDQGNPVDAQGNLVDGQGHAIRPDGTIISDLDAESGSGAHPLASGLGKAVGTLIKAPWWLVKKTSSTVYDLGKGGAIGIYDGVKAVANDTKNGIVTLAKDATHSVGNVTEDVYDGAVDVTRQIYKGGVKVAQDAQQGGYRVGADLAYSIKGVKRDMGKHSQGEDQEDDASGQDLSGEGDLQNTASKDSDQDAQGDAQGDADGNADGQDGTANANAPLRRDAAATAKKRRRSTSQEDDQQQETEPGSKPTDREDDTRNFKIKQHNEN